MRMRRLAGPLGVGGLFAVGALALAYGCSSGSDVTNPLIFTSVYVDPVTIELAAPCSKLEGGAQSYVAQLIDVTDPDHQVLVQSSPAVRCDLRATFGSVVPGHFYTGTIKVFSLPVCDPPRLEDNCIAGSDTSVTEDWKLECGDASLVPLYDAGIRVYPDGGGLTDADIDAGIEAVPIDPQEPTPSYQDVQVKLKGCHVVSSSVVGQTTSVLVSPMLNPEGLKCDPVADAGVDDGGVVYAGGISHWTITPSDTSLAAVDVPCNASHVFTLANTPKRLDFRVDAYVDGQQYPSFGTSCTSVPVQGQTVIASCDPLAATGSFVVEPGSIFGSRCNDEDIVSYQVDLLGKGTSGTLPCQATARFDGLSAGLYTASVTATDVHGVTSDVAVCKAYVSPGSAVFATCEVTTITP